MVIRDTQSNKIIGRVVTNHSLTLDEAMQLAGFVWRADEDNSGWTKDGGRTVYDESSATMDYETD